jgi:hypothetical protein
MGLPRAAARAAVDVIHAPAYTAPVVVECAGGADDSRRQLRAASRVVSLSARRDATHVLSPERADGGPGADRFRVLGRRDRGRVSDSSRTNHRGAAGCLRSLRARRSSERDAPGSDHVALLAARRRSARATKPAARRARRCSRRSDVRVCRRSRWCWPVPIAASATVCGLRTRRRVT